MREQGRVFGEAADFAACHMLMGRVLRAREEVMLVGSC